MIVSISVWNHRFQFKIQSLACKYRAGEFRDKKKIQDSMAKFFVGKILAFILEQKKGL